ncbi:hypothetical protein D3C87_563910 [compost metagenome]
MQKTRQNAGFPFNPPSMMAVFMFVLVFVATTRMRATIVTQVITDRTTRRAAQTCANGRTRRAAEAVANDRATRRAETTANGGFGSVAFIRPDGTPGRAANTRTYRRASTATELSTDHIAERAAQAATHSGGAITSGHRPLCYQQTEKQCR